MHGTARSGFERRRERDARFCVAAEVWETRLAALVEFLPEKPVPARIWRRIQCRLVVERFVIAHGKSPWAAAFALGVPALALTHAYFPLIGPADRENLV